MRYYLTILLFVFIISCKEKSPKFSGNNMETQVDSILDANGFNGVVLIAKDDSILYHKAKGFSNLETKTSLQLEDQFVIGSISKQITAVLIVREYEKGKIRLDDKINKYLTDISQPWSKEVTIHQLLTHTHGIVAVEKPLLFKPGTQFKYSQIGYELLANILEKINNEKSFETIATGFFRKHNLNNTFHPNNKEYKNLVNGYEEDENGEMIFEKNSLYNYVPAGSFISNAEDLYNWNKLLYSGKLVNGKTLELMKKKYATRIHPIFDTVGYGYGLLFKNGEENVEIGALGYAPGFVSASYYYPLTKINVVVLENTSRSLDDFKEKFNPHLEVMKLVKAIVVK